MAELLHRAFRVVRVVPEGRVGVTLVLDGALPAQPGQFAMVWLPGVEERPYSLADDAPATISVANVGPLSAALCARHSGQRVWLRGPYGHGFAPHGERPLLIGGGSGVAGLTLLARALRALEQPVKAVVGARSADALMLRWHLSALGCELLTATDDGSEGWRGTALDAAQPLLSAGAVDSLYACGPEPMLRAVALRARELSLPCWVSLERVMRCGLGVCGTCHCGDRLVCVDGPVFPAEVFLACTDTTCRGDLAALHISFGTATPNTGDVRLN